MVFVIESPRAGRRVAVRCLALAAVALLGIRGASAQSALRVDAAAPPGGSGGSWLDAIDDLQLAINAWMPGQQIWVKVGTYRPSTSATPLDPRTFTFSIPPEMELYGGFAGGENSLQDRPDNLYTQTILSGDSMTPANRSDDVYTVVTLPPGDPTKLRVVDGFQIQFGNANSTSFAVPAQRRGGGLYSEDANLWLWNCTVTNNLAYRGAGLYYENTDPTEQDHGLAVVRCSFVGNVAIEAGGGMALHQAGGNSAIPVSHVFNSLFDRNWAGNSNWIGAFTGGGGIYVENRTVPADKILEIYNCVFYGNSARAGAGGGIYLRAGSTTPPLFSDRVSVRNCTLTGNTSSAIDDPATGTPIPGGAGMWVEAGYAQSLIANCILWDNRGSLNPSDLTGPGTRIGGASAATAIPVRYSDLLYQLPVVPPGPTAHPGPGNIAADPLFQNPAGYDFGLQFPSPCLDAGNSNLIAPDHPDFAMDGPLVLGPCPIDFLGSPRDVDYPGIQGPGGVSAGVGGVIVDMGAVEEQP